MENPSSSSSSSVSSLLPQEPEISTSSEEHVLDLSFMTSISSDNGFSDSADYVQLLLKKEIADFDPTRVRGAIDIARLRAVSYILHTREILGLHFQTAYLSITYLDQFLAVRALQSEYPWVMNLLSIGCLSLAAKVQEVSSWGLSCFQGGEFRFELKTIQRIELLILCTLDWKMGSITPFDYIPYFISVLFSKTPRWIILSKILELVMGIVKDGSLMGHYPSAIALAAILLSNDQTLTINSLELKINSMPCSRFLDLDDIASCYFMMQESESERDPTEMPNLPSSPELSPANISNRSRSSPDSSSISSKRKRLDFDDSENQNQGWLDKKQHGSDSSDT